LQYGFYDEIILKYSSDIFEYNQNVSAKPPLYAIVGEQIFCVHFGIRNKSPLLSEIEMLSKPLTIHEDNLITNFIWSDPREQQENFFQVKED
jgi:hypothetical protein